MCGPTATLENGLWGVSIRGPFSSQGCQQTWRHVALFGLGWTEDIHANARKVTAGSISGVARATVPVGQTFDEFVTIPFGIDLETLAESLKIAELPNLHVVERSGVDAVVLLAHFVWVCVNC